jgi:regulatory protein
VPVVTGLAPDPRHPGYRLVEVDRGRFASLPAERVEPLGLMVGSVLEPPVLARLQELADEEGAHRAALRKLATRAHARADLRRRLLQKQHPPAAVDRALERLAGRGLLDDARFAAEYAVTRAGRGRGPARLIGDLLRQGIERRLAETAVAQALAAEGIDPERQASEVVAKRAGQLAHVPLPARKRRLMAFLVRRGYAGASARKLVEQACRGEEAPP